MLVELYSAVLDILAHRRRVFKCRLNSSSAEPFGFPTAALTESDLSDLKNQFMQKQDEKVGMAALSHHSKPIHSRSQTDVMAPLTHTTSPTQRIMAEAWLQHESKSSCDNRCLPGTKLGANCNITM
jgi:hypothetical protein